MPHEPYEPYQIPRFPISLVGYYHPQQAGGITSYNNQGSMGIIAHMPLWILGWLHMPPTGDR